MTPDTLDAASELTQQRIEMAVAAHRLNHSAVSATHCEECGDPLIPERRDRFLDVRSALVVRKMKKSGIGGCDGLQQDE